MRFALIEWKVPFLEKLMEMINLGLTDLQPILKLGLTFLECYRLFLQNLHGLLFGRPVFLKKRFEFFELFLKLFNNSGFLINILIQLCVFIATLIILSSDFTYLELILCIVDTFVISFRCILLFPLILTHFLQSGLQCSQKLISLSQLFLIVVDWVLVILSFF